jgi:hypothetical protein
VLTEILTDEVAHSRLGWQMLSSLAPRIDGRMRRRLGDYLVPAFEQLFERHRAAAGMRHPTGADALGVLDHQDWTTLFANVVNEVIVPRLEAFDLPARAAVEAALTPPAEECVVWAATD